MQNIGRAVGNAREFEVALVPFLPGKLSRLRQRNDVTRIRNPGLDTDIEYRSDHAHIFMQENLAMRDQRGLTLIELIVVVAVVSVMVGITVAYSLPWLAKETMRSGANDVQSFMQLAKIEAVSRNRECRFVVDASSGTLEVWDSLGTDDDSDDVRLHLSSLPTSIAFDSDRPSSARATSSRTPTVRILAA